MNEAMRDYWNGDVGRTWVDMQARMDVSLRPVAAALLQAASPSPGERVLDIGCGAGDTTLALATAVAPDGHVLGVDVSVPLLDRARDRAAGTSAAFVEADAASFATTLRFDLIVSRFGVMFFDDPVIAFAHIRGLAEPGCRLVSACWRAPAENRWATLPMRALAGLLPAAAPGDPHSPGPFAFADADRVRAILSGAGWNDITATPFDFAMRMGEGADPAGMATDFALRIGPAARAIADATAADAPIDRDAVAATLTHAFTAELTGGAVELPAAVWIVTARA